MKKLLNSVLIALFVVFTFFNSSKETYGQADPFAPTCGYGIVNNCKTGYTPNPVKSPNGTDTCECLPSSPPSGDPGKCYPNGGNFCNPGFVPLTYLDPTDPNGVNQACKCEPGSATQNTRGTCQLSASKDAGCIKSPADVGKVTISGGQAAFPLGCTANGGNGISTALGCIPVGDTNAFIGWFLKWALGISGGIAFLLMIFAGFQIMTSTGNPDKIQGGKELLNAAISGLVLIIFSLFLLKLIGVDILGLPGFGS